MTSASVIGQTTVIRGGIRGEGDLEILGTVEGSIIVQGEVTIGETALIKSDVRASRVIVRGAVRGNVSADELLILEAGARVLGDLGAPQVGIRPGGLVKGHVSTSGPLPLERPKPAAVAKAAPAPARAAAPAARPAPTPVRAAPTPVRATPAPAPRAAAPVRPVAPAAAIPAPRPSSPRNDVAVAPAPPAPEPEIEAPAEPPPPVVPALPKGARASMKKKGAK